MISQQLSSLIEFIYNATRPVVPLPTPLADDPVDQLALILLGGVFIGLAARDVWDHDGPCPCSVPEPFFGNGSVVVELGANDGLHMSNGYFFERQLGWRSVCIEANPTVFHALVQNRPGCINIHALVGRPEDFNGSAARFLSFNAGSDSGYDGDGTHSRAPSKRRAAAAGGLSWESGMSAVEGVSVHRVAGSLSAAQNWARHISKFRAPLSVRADTLPVRPLTSLLLAHGVSTVDLLVLDVEGAETTVLRSLDLSRVRVRLLAIETVDAAARQLLRHHGFRDTGFRAALGDAFWVHERYFHEKFGRGGSDGHIARRRRRRH